MADEPGEVVPLVTAREREVRAETSFDQLVHDEAVAMLERALEMAKERQLTGVAIAFGWADGSYGRMTPTLRRNWATLIGSVATMQHDLIEQSMAPDE